MPEDRYEHTQSGLINCGGYGETPCLTFTAGQWVKSHPLQHLHDNDHSSWLSQYGVVLLRGYAGYRVTTELLTEDGGSTPAFTLKYETR